MSGGAQRAWTCERQSAVTRLLAGLIGLVLASCADPPPEASEPPAIQEPTAAASVGPSSPAQLTATNLLECDGPVDTVGGAGESLAQDIGVGGSTPDEALAAFLAATPFVVPLSGYEPLATSGDRYAYGFRADGEVKVVVVFSPRDADPIDERYAPDELRACSESEFGEAVDFGGGTRVWTHTETGLIVTDFAGPAHCEWQSARMLHIEQDDGSVTQYLRDPEGVFDFAPLLETYAEDTELPADAMDSGYRSREGFELWFTLSDRAAYVVTPDGIERWPRAEEPVGCM
jgi:hypothetical protein